MSLEMARYCHRPGNLGVLSKWGSFQMFKIELCYFFIIFVMPAGLCAWMMQIGIMIPLNFHLARYTQIALRGNATVTLREQKVQMSAFSLTKNAMASFLSLVSLSFFFLKSVLLWSHSGAWVGRGVVSGRIWSFEEAHRFSGFKDIFWRATKPLLGLPACS